MPINGGLSRRRTCCRSLRNRPVANHNDAVDASSSRPPRVGARAMRCLQLAGKRKAFGCAVNHDRTTAAVSGIHMRPFDLLVLCRETAVAAPWSMLNRRSDDCSTGELLNQTAAVEA